MIVLAEAMVHRFGKEKWGNRIGPAQRLLDWTGVDSINWIFSTAHLSEPKEPKSSLMGLKRTPPRPD